jgi:hypothetical protein
VKKLISIGVALALLTMAVVPGAVGAYTEPATFAKIPFAIIQSGLELVGSLLNSLASTLGLPDWLDDVVLEIAPWAGGPLSWTVDMMAWGIDLGATVLGSLASTLGLPDWLAPLLSDIACGLFTPFTTNITGPPFAPCG